LRRAGGPFRLRGRIDSPIRWPTFFLLAFIVALPGLVFVWLLRKEIERAEAASAS
jgi:hypothetical protein